MENYKLLKMKLSKKVWQAAFQIMYAYHKLRLHSPELSLLLQNIEEVVSEKERIKPIAQYNQEDIIHQLSIIDLKKNPNFAKNIYEIFHVFFDREIFSNKILLKNEEVKTFLSWMIQENEHKSKNISEEIMNISKYSKVLPQEKLQKRFNNWLNNLPLKQITYWETVLDKNIIKILLKTLEKIELSEELKNKIFKIKFQEQTNQQLFNKILKIDMQDNLFDTCDQNKTLYSIKVKINYSYLFNYFPKESQFIIQNLVRNIFKFYEGIFQEMKIINLEDKKNDEMIFATEDISIYQKNIKMKKELDIWISDHLEKILQLSAKEFINKVQKKEYNNEIEIIIDSFIMQYDLKNQLKDSNPINHVNKI